MKETQTFIIIGAGQAGGWIARTVRMEGFEGRIVLIGEERHLPYERPPLSKGALLGAAAMESTRLWPPESYDTLAIEALPGRCVMAIHRTARQITLDNGELLGYDRLAIATGARPRLLPVEGAGLAGIHYLRTIDDALAIRNDIREGSTVLVIGGGWIGMEVAATLVQLNCRPVVVEMADRLCARAVPPDISQWMLGFHQEHGVHVKLQTGVERLEGSGRIERAVLSNGETIHCTAAVAGIGVLANTELAETAGLRVNNGILIDDHCRTSDPDIFSAGDVANHPNLWMGRRIRLESWENAQNQGIAAGKSMLGKGVAYDSIPWFWSDQHDANIQMIGMPENWDETATRQKAGETAFLRMYLREGRIIGAVSVNNARELGVAKRLMQAGKAWSVDDLTNPDIRMQVLLRR